ncbi:MAG TPA: asparaginase [Noviherbaspirillum sp.]
MNFAPLAEVTRGGEVESVHAGAVAVVNTNGELLYHAGDPHFPTFTRSTIKPFQALPFMCAGGPARFGFGNREMALMCASHSGEPVHVSTVQAMLAKAGCDEHHLQCGCHEPMHYAIVGRTPPEGETFSQLHNNCSGKHAGFLAHCVQHGLPLDTYLAPGHPLQQAIRSRLASVTGLAEADLKMGIDGCSAPNYALPLSRLAFAYARLAQGERAAVDSDAMGRLFTAMTAHPELVSGTGRIDLALMQTAPDDWVAKGGAEAVQVLGIRSAGLGIAIKVADGASRGLPSVTIAVLQQLGLLGASVAPALADWVRPAIRNLKGVQTGEIRAVVKLAKN